MQEYKPRSRCWEWESFFPTEETCTPGTGRFIAVWRRRFLRGFSSAKTNPLSQKARKGGPHGSQHSTNDAAFKGIFRTSGHPAPHGTPGQAALRDTPLASLGRKEAAL